MHQANLFDMLGAEYDYYRDITNSKKTYATIHLILVYSLYL